MRYVLFIAFFLLLTGCAHQLAKPIDENIAVNLTLVQVKTKMPDSVGQRVRWGGVIANVNNAPQSTIIEIVARPLNRQGRPMAVDQTAGRFLARIDGFIDPVVYAKGRDITVVGAVSNEETQLIDAFEYKYVAIQVDHYKLWPLIVERPVFYYDSYWYAPLHLHHRKHRAGSHRHLHSSSPPSRSSSKPALKPSPKPSSWYKEKPEKRK